MIDWALRISTLMVLVVFLNVMGGYLEGWVAPVTGPMIIERVEPAANNSSRIWGRFEIRRPSCDFKDMEWSFIGTRRNVGVAHVFEEGLVEREGGWNDFGPWLIQMKPEVLIERGQGVALHDCPWGWWPVETVMKEPNQ